MKRLLGVASLLLFMGAGASTLVFFWTVYLLSQGLGPELVEHFVPVQEPILVAVIPCCVAAALWLGWWWTVRLSRRPGPQDTMQPDGDRTSANR